jgi:hypothetical protein
MPAPKRPRAPGSSFPEFQVDVPTPARRTEPKPFEIEYVQASSGDEMLERQDTQEEMEARASQLINLGLAKVGSVRLYSVVRKPIGVGSNFLTTKR